MVKKNKVGRPRKVPEKDWIHDDSLREAKINYKEPSKFEAFVELKSIGILFMTVLVLACLAVYLFWSFLHTLTFLGVGILTFIISMLVCNWCFLNKYMENKNVYTALDIEIISVLISLILVFFITLPVNGNDYTFHDQFTWHDVDEQIQQAFDPKEPISSNEVIEIKQPVTERNMEVDYSIPGVKHKYERNEFEVGVVSQICVENKPSDVSGNTFEKYNDYLYIGQITCWFDPYGYYDIDRSKFVMLYKAKLTEIKTQNYING